jgi:hypothetical protein
MYKWDYVANLYVHKIHIFVWEPLYKYIKKEIKTKRNKDGKKKSKMRKWEKEFFLKKK